MLRLFLLMVMGLCGLVSHDARAKEFKIHRCQNPDGSIVLQDAWCKPEQKILGPGLSAQAPRNKPQAKPRNKPRRAQPKSGLRPPAQQAKPLSRPTPRASVMPPVTGAPQSGAEVSRGYLLDQHITVRHRPHWQVGTRTLERKMLHFDFSNGSAADALQLNLDFVVIPAGQRFSRNDLKDLLQGVSEWMARQQQSIPEDWIHDMQLDSGTGIYGVFERAGQGYPYITKGYMHRFGFLVQFSILSQRVEGPDYAAALNLVHHGIQVSRVRL